MPDSERIPNLLIPQEAPAEKPVDLGVEQGESHDGIGETSPATRLESPSPVSPVSMSQEPQDPNSPQSKILKDVEKMLSDGLKDVYAALPPERKVLFKTQGEQVARVITDRIMNHHVDVKEIWTLTSAWLGNLPGVNKYFLEQEIKIKTDQLIGLAEVEQETA